MGDPSGQVKQREGTGQSFLEALANVPLVGVASRPERRLPKGPGEKKQRLEGTREETVKLHDYLSEQLVAQSAVRTTSRKAMSKASWDGDVGIARVTIQKGSHWSIHGHSHASQLVLEPHEALFLLEMGCLELAVGGLPMTLQQAYHTLLGDTLPLQHYTVVASLKRCGYVVRRGYIWPPSTAPQATPTTATGVELLRVHPSCPLCHPPPPPAPSLCTCVLEVYQPRGSFKKSNPGPPDCRICMVTPQDTFPPPSHLRQLSTLDPPAPLRYCVVDGSCLTYYTLTQGTVPEP